MGGWRGEAPGKLITGISEEEFSKTYQQPILMILAGKILPSVGFYSAVVVHQLFQSVPLDQHTVQAMIIF